ncbi:MAG: hypothetical protein K2O45_08805 [Oscillospiraceae bacterium]|nr:hypothetical protein [Oscillospiraceae bacterium]
MSSSPILRNRMTYWSMPQISVNTLKMIGTILMVLYFFSASVVQNGILHMSDYTTDQLNELLAADGRMMLWAGIGSVGSVVGVMGVPIFAYLLVLGVEYTSDLRRYAAAVLIAAFVSEIPYDLAMSGQMWNWLEQNSLWTVLITLVMLWLLRRFQGPGMVPLLLSFFITAAGCFWAVFLRCKFGGGFVLIAALLYLLRGHKGVSYGLGALVSLIYATAPLGFVLVALCDGQRRSMGQWGKYAYYALYPITMILFAVWTVMI